MLLFSQSLRTLDFIEMVLGIEDWSAHAPSVDTISGDGRKFGSWKKNVDYLRIDGSTSSVDRGALVNQFSETPDENRLKLFLISSKAGGIG